MSGQWRLFLAALRFVARRPPGTGDSDERATPHEATRFVPLVGIILGMIGGGAYWLACKIWPTSIAVVVSMLAMMLLCANVTESRAPRDGTRPAAAGDGDRRVGAPCWIVILLIKYNALMALSAASAPFSLPTDLTLGLIMVAGQAASRALVVSVMADTPPLPGVTAVDLTIALVVGMAPATLLGIPGLMGLVAAIAMRLGFTSRIPAGLVRGLRARPDIAQHLTEGCFYLGALATWKYV